MDGQSIVQVKEVIMSWRKARKYLNARKAAILAMAVLLSLVTVQAAYASIIRYKISGEMPPFGDVRNDFQISPDERYVVYVADQQTDEAFELYRAPIMGGQPPVRLSDLLPTGCAVYSPQFSPDSSRVVYLAPQDTIGVLELYSVPIGGGTAVKLNGALVAGGDVWGFLISPDGGRVVYSADQQTDGVRELYSVPIGGGTAVKLNGPLVAGGDVSDFDFKISPYGGQVVYSADQQTDEVWELYRVPIGGGTAVKLNGALVAGGDVSGYRLSPDGSRVVYIADQQTDGVYELYSVPIGGGTAVKLNGALVAGGFVGGFKISPDGGRVVYRADQQTNEVWELYSVPIGGGTAVKLNGALVASGDVTESYQISPDSGRVVYYADQQTNEVWELYSVLIGGGTVVKLNGLLVAGGDVSESSFQISPDGAWVVYSADQDIDERFQLYSVPIQGGAVVEVHRPNYLRDNPGWQFEISPDSGRVVYVVRPFIPIFYEPYVVSSSVATGWAGGETFLGYGKDYEPFFKISPSGIYVVYNADPITLHKLELYSTFEGLFLPLVMR
jgi:Tol biopolymer transport system component